MKRIKTNLFFFALSLFVGIVIYIPSFRAPFVLDGVKMIQENPVIRSLDLSRIWSLDPSRFLSHLSFALNYHWGQLEVTGYHYINFGLHGLTALCVFLLTRELFNLCLPTQHEGLPTGHVLAFYAGCVFWVHPLQTAAVTYIVQRSTLFAALFYTAAMVFYLYFRKTRCRVYYGLSLLAAVAGAFSKPIIITLPLVLAYLELFLLKGREAYDIEAFKKFSFKMPLFKELAFLLPYTFLFILVPWLLMLYTGRFDLTEISRQTDMISRPHYLYTQLNVIVHYIRLGFIPVGQIFDYDFPVSTRLWEFPTFLSFLVIAGLIGVAVKHIRSHKLLAFSIFFFFMTLSLESTIFPLSDVIFEHRMYLPLVSFAILIPVSVFCYAPRSLRHGLMLGIILIFSVLTFQRNWLWGHPIRFHQENVQRAPGKPRPHVSLGLLYWQQGRYALARESFHQAMEVDPDYAKAYLGMGALYQTLGDFSRALRSYRDVIRLDPLNDEAYNNSGIIWAVQQNLDKAVTYFNAALARNPHNVNAYNNRGRAFESMGQYERAVNDYTQAIALDPGNITMYLNRARVYTAMEHYSKALKDLDRVKRHGHPEVDPFMETVRERWEASQ